MNRINQIMNDLKEEHDEEIKRMSDEKVIEVLQEQITKYGQEYDEEGIKALTYAIKVIRQKQVNKDIDYSFGYKDGYDDGFNDARELYG